MGLAAVVMLTFAGCGSAAGSGESESAAAYDTAMAYDNGIAVSGSTTSYSQSEAPMTEELTTETVPGQAVSARKLIKTVNMSVETAEYDALSSLLYQQVEALGGYMEYFSTNGSETNRSGSMTARIPKQSLDAFLELVEGNSNVTYRQENVEDVTLSYVDLESHKKMLQKEQERLLELLDRAETIEDIIQLESRLTDVQYQLESMESQLRTYDNLIDYSTVYLSITEVVRYTPQEQAGVWDRIRIGFRENLYAVGDGLMDFGIGLIIHIPNIVVFLIVAGILALIIRAMVRRRRRAEENRRQGYMQMRTMQQPPMQGEDTANERIPQTEERDK
ncbi:MAG: DUF4349 domain-containing protein [Roseburia sp.]|nr:DUF4349 domain-containing protein [Roseburia sp.]